MNLTRFLLLAATAFLLTSCFHRKVDTNVDRAMERFDRSFEKADKKSKKSAFDKDDD